MKIKYKIKNKIEPFALEDIHEYGYIGHLLDREIYNRMTSDFAKNEVYSYAENAFRTKKDDDTAVCYWQGEFWGKWMISACRACRYSHDEKLKEFIREGVYTLMSTADHRGYIGTYKDSMNMFMCSEEEGIACLGYPCRWNWNIWCRKYTLWGLLEAYMLLSEAPILDAAVKFTDHLIGELHENGIKISDTGTFVGMPSGSILKPLLILYRITGDGKYLDFSLEIADAWDDPSGKAPNLIRNAFSGGPLYDWFPDNRKWAKAYEMMSCLDGLLELYRVTGNSRYYEAVKAIFDIIWKYERNAFFSAGFNDQFMSGSEYINSASEPCDVIHLLRLVFELYCLDGEKKYMDIAELVCYNPLLASLTYDSKWGARIVRSSGKHQYAPPQPGPIPLPNNHCCVNNLPRGMLNLAECAVMSRGDNIYINFFTQYGLNGKVKITIGDGYLSNGKVTIKTENASNVYVRKPEYSRYLKINGSEIEERDGYCLVPDEIKDEFTLEFCQNPRVVKFDHEMKEPAQDDVHTKRYTLSPSEVGYVSPEVMVHGDPDRIMYGPLLLARSIRIGDTKENMMKVSGGHDECVITPTDFDCKEFQGVFDVNLKLRGTTEKVRMCDFASAGKVIDETKFDYIFNMYI